METTLENVKLEVEVKCEIIEISDEEVNVNPKRYAPT